MSDTEVQTAPPRLDIQEGDHEKFAHYVIGGNEAIIHSMLTGEPCTALCGKVWVPSRDPELFPVCPVCEEEKRTWGS